MSAPHKPTEACVDTCDNPYVCAEEYEAFVTRCVNAHDELVSALERYATHASDCSVRQALGIRCDCGLSDVFQRYVLKARGEQP